MFVECNCDYQQYNSPPTQWRWWPGEDATLLLLPPLCYLKSSVTMWLNTNQLFPLKNIEIRISFSDWSIERNLFHSNSIFHCRSLLRIVMCKVIGILYFLLLEANNVPSHSLPLILLSFSDHCILEVFLPDYLQDHSQTTLYKYFYHSFMLQKEGFFSCVFSKELRTDH